MTELQMIHHQEQMAAHRRDFIANWKLNVDPIAFANGWTFKERCEMMHHAWKIFIQTKNHHPA